jgi:hypothetical protein
VDWGGGSLTNGGDSELSFLGGSATEVRRLSFGSYNGSAARSYLATMATGSRPPPATKVTGSQPLWLLWRWRVVVPSLRCVVSNQHDRDIDFIDLGRWASARIAVLPLPTRSDTAYSPRSSRVPSTPSACSMDQLFVRWRLWSVQGDYPGHSDPRSD